METTLFPGLTRHGYGGLALNGSINYRICSGLYAGIGIEPTGYFKTDKLKENLEGQVFDFPIVLTLGYEFKNGMKLSASYKHGFSHCMTMLLPPIQRITKSSAYHYMCPCLNNNQLLIFFNYEKNAFLVLLWQWLSYHHVVLMT